MPDSPYTDLERPPLSARALRRALIVPGSLWTRVELRDETDSTNADAIRAARAGAAEGLVVVAERQLAGRGRLGRTWVSPARAGLAVSVLLRPGEAVPVSRYGWLPLLAGVALVDAVRRLTDLDAVLKWPNDLLVPTGGNGVAGHGKCAGVLAEATAGALVVGVGLNVTVRAEELPESQPGGPPATSLLLAGARATDRDPLLRALLRALADWYGRWRDTGGDANGCGLHEAYVRACATVGRTVRVLLPGGAELAGAATGIDGDGRLIVQTSAGGKAVAAGDVLHVR